MWNRRFILFILLIASAFSVAAFERTFPDIAKRGKMTPGNHPMIGIDGKVRAMSIGGRIFNQDNLIAMPASIRGHDIVVNYTETDDGEIDRIWILSREEASQKLQQPQVLPFKPFPPFQPFKQYQPPQ